MLKKSASDFRASAKDLFPWISCCDRFTTPIKPNFRGYTLPERISNALVPWSMRSILVRTPIVRLPSGSTWRASFRASEFTISTLAGDTARIMLLGLAIYSEIRFRVCFSMSVGWSPMGTYKYVNCAQSWRRDSQAYLCQSRQVHQRQAQDVW